MTPPTNRYPALQLDPGFRRHLVRAFSVAAVFYVLAATVSTSFFHPDQHFQTLEFADFKLDPSNEATLAWEYRAAIRPWLQPYIYMGVIKGAQALGVRSPFTIDRLIRLASGALGLLAVVAFVIVLAWWLPLAAQKKWLAWIFALFWLFPTLHTRTSGENMSATFMLLAISSLFLLRRGDATPPPVGSSAAPFTGPLRFSLEGVMASAVCLGLMFHFRYQMGPVMVALVAWMLIMARTPVRLLLAYGLTTLVVVAAGVGLDTLGYGSFQVAAWNYLHANLVEGVAASYGVEPWYYYLKAPLEAPLGILLVPAVLVFGVRYPGNLLTWLMAVFLLEHTAVAHKEFRFLYPIAHLALAMGVFLVPRRWYQAGDSDNPFLGHAVWARWAFWFFAVVNVGALVYHSLRPPHPEVSVHKFISSTEPDHFEFVSLGGSPFVWPPGCDGCTDHRMEFYAPERFTHHVVAAPAEVDAFAVSNPGIYFYHIGIALPDTPEWAGLRARCRMAYQSYGPVFQAANFTDWLGRMFAVSIYRCGDSADR
jgi:phosphatidylinositol glycan class B